MSLRSFLVPGITGWRSRQEGEYVCGSGSCAFCDKGIPLWIACSPEAPGASGSSRAIGLCSVSDVIGVCISPAIVLLLQQGWGLQCPLLLLLPSPASLHPRRATLACLSLLDFQKQLFGFCAVGDLAFQSHGRTLELVRGESGSWTQLGLHCVSSWPLLCSGSSFHSHTYTLLDFISFLFFFLSSNFFFFKEASGASHVWHWIFM